MNLSGEELDAVIAVVETGSFRKAALKLHKSQSSISYQIKNLEDRKEQIQMMQQMTDEAIAILQDQNGSFEAFGKLLHENWSYKKSLSDRVSTPEIDQIYQTAIDCGAYGGKLLGAGGGGFMIFFAPPEVQPKIREKLDKLVHVNFRFEHFGSKIVIYEPYSF